MPPRASLAYRTLVRVAAGLIPVAARWQPRLARGHQGRRDTLERFRAWGSSADGRDPGRPLVWFHAPSVGEGRQAEAVMARVRAARPDWQLAYTHFSPSAEALATELPADIAGYLPWDTPGATSAALEALAPTALVFVKLDLWPTLATAARARGTGVALVAGTVSRESGRDRPWVRRLLRAGYQALDRVGAVSDDDGERLVRLGVPPDRIETTGDPRADSVLARVAAVQPDDPLLTVAPRRGTLVAGSTWPSDESVLLGALARLRDQGHRAERLVLVPHEPDPAHLNATERTAAATGLRVCRLSNLAADSDSWDVLLVDRTGVLATLYGAGQLAYVGGGYGRAGLHSVLEPAAWSRPVAFGPRWRGSRDAELLLGAEAGQALPEHPEAAAARLAALWLDWQQAEGQAAGPRARGVVEAGAGAAERNARLVVELVEWK